MAKSIVVLADGTWDTPEQTDRGILSPSNVALTRDALLSKDAKGRRQFVCYHTGVGERGGLWDRATGGAFGADIDANILDLYVVLALNYQPDDDLYLLGFSRGAYTARSLAGLIRNSGILRPEKLGQLDAAYTLYRDRDPRSAPDADRAREFREQNSYPDFDIHFIGVWDTVGSLGLPPLPASLLTRVLRRWEWEQYQFHDTSLSRHMRHAYHALALDEKRNTFQPTLWQQQTGAPASQVLVQAWFPGVHCNIGGGYEGTGLSNGALLWMWRNAKKAGLKFIDEDRWPRANSAGQLRNSCTGIYRLLNFLFGDFIRMPLSFGPRTNEYLHRSVLKREARLPMYRPDNFIDFVARSPPVVPSRQPAQGTTQGAARKARMPTKPKKTKTKTKAKRAKTKAKKTKTGGRAGKHGP